MKNSGCEALLVSERRFTSVHSRYQVTGEICGEGESIDFWQTMDEAQQSARRAAERGYVKPQIFDRHARRGAWQVWELGEDGWFRAIRMRSRA